LEEQAVLRAVIVLAVIAIALLRGGTLRNFAEVHLRWLPLVFGSLGLQLLIFTPLLGGRVPPLVVTTLYLISMALLVVWVTLNRQIPGIVLIAAGVVMNTVAIAANGGYMPVDPAAAAYAGRLENYASEGAPISNNSLATSENVRLWLLTDIFPVPAGIPLANVFSLGDILLTVGVAIFCSSVISGGYRSTATTGAEAAQQSTTEAIQA
jgi:hypothetical protein